MIERFQLSIARDRQAILGTLAAPVESVTVAAFTVNQAACLLHKGHGDPGALITQEGQTWEWDPPWTDGFFLSTPGGGSGVIDIAVEIRTYQAPQPVVDVTRARPVAKSGPDRFLDQLLRNFGIK